MWGQFSIIENNTINRNGDQTFKIVINYNLSNFKLFVVQPGGTVIK